MDIQNKLSRLKAQGLELADNVATNVQNNISTSANISVDGVIDSVAGSVQDLKGATVDIANSLNGITGPAVGQSIVGNIANGIGGQLVDQISGGIGGFLGSAFGSGFGNSFGGIGKQPNPLEQFASYNYIFTLGCLSDDELNFPDFTYRRRDPDVVILRSGGGPTPGSTSGYDQNGKTEYFIDDVEIETIVAGNANTRSTNATSLQFKVSEPYSMGLFLQTLQLAAKRARGPDSTYLEAPYLLTVEFKGYDDAGNFIHASNLRRMFPLKLVDIQFEVTESGSQYAVTAIPYQEVALTDETQTSHTETQFSGATVAEMLQTGAKSFTKILNDRQILKEEAKQVGKGDQYIILFPKTSSSAQESELFMQGQPEQGDDSATTRKFTEEEIKEFYVSQTGDANGKVPDNYEQELENNKGISVKRSSLGENIREYGEKLEFMNDIGKAKITKSNLDAGTQPMTGATQAESETTKGKIDRCKVTRTGDIRSSAYSAGKKIQDVIEETIILSEYGRNIADKKADGNGMVPWFRIQTQVFNADESAKTIGSTGKPARVFVYRVVPYLVHRSKFQGSSDASPGIVNLQRQAIKEYNYIYTGKNKDILNFDISFNAAFFTSIAGDSGQLGRDSKTAVTDEVTGGNARAVSGKGESTSNLDTVSKSTDKVVKPNSVDGGGPVIHPESQVARDFNEALVNSPVDLMMVDLEIMGDPYYIVDSGMGNYNALQVPGLLNITKDGTMNYENGEVDIELNFRTPLDYGQNYMDFPGGGTAPVGQFSGLYQVLFCKNSFSNGQFTQTLQTIRRRAQPSETTEGTTATSGLLNLDNPAAQLAETFANTLNGDAIKLAKALTGGQAGLGNIAAGALGELDQKLANAISTVRNGSIPKPITDAASKGIAQGNSTDLTGLQGST
jgi:hypothetical protein